MFWPHWPNQRILCAHGAPSTAIPRYPPTLHLARIPNMAQHQFDFQAFIRRRKSAAEREAILHFEDYAFVQDMRQRRRLHQFGAIRQALRWFGRYWAWRERAAYLKACSQVGEKQARLHALWIEACLHFRVERPNLYLSPALADWMTVLGTAAESFVVLREDIVQRSRAEILCVMGSALGAVHNAHAPEMTLLAYAQKWMQNPWQKQVSQALGALISWNKVACITRDRAALLLSRDFDACVTMMIKERTDWGEDEIRVELSRLRQNLSVNWEDRELSHRIAALSLFMHSQYYQRTKAHQGEDLQALSLSVVDEKIQDMLSKQPW